MKRLFLIIMAVATTLVAEAMEQQPLYIVDGRVVGEKELKAIPSEDIESVTTINSEEQLRKFEHFGDTSNGVVVVARKSREDADEIFIATDVMPSFMGNGDLRTFQNWVMENLRYPDEALNKNLEETIIVQFIINREGYIMPESIKAMQCNNEVFFNEAKRVIALSPRWTPAILRGFTVAMSMVLPIEFKIYKGEASQHNTEPTIVLSNENATLDNVVVLAFNDGDAANKEPLWIVDGRVATSEEVRAIPSQKIKFMSVLKEGTGYYDEFGDTSNGVVLINLKSDDIRVEDNPDTLPQFLGGDFTTFQEWIVQNTRYPQHLAEENSDIWAHLLVKFIVNSTGFVEVTEIVTMKGTPSRYFDEEVRRVMNSAPRWTPAMKGGSPVAVQVSIPFIFGRGIE